jgi:Ca2+-binding EF-hand superfamily protein
MESELEDKVSSTMDSAELQEFRDIFALFDTDGSGTIDADEVSKAMSN